MGTVKASLRRLAGADDCNGANIGVGEKCAAHEKERWEVRDEAKIRRVTLTRHSHKGCVNRGRGASPHGR